MKELIWIVVIVGILVLLVVSARSSKRTGVAEDLIASLSWLAGDWEGDFEGAPFACHYTTPQGGVILSISKEFQQDKSCFYEFEKFETIDDEIVMIPYPAGNVSVPFTLIDYDPKIKKAAFENNEHDFPTSLTYELTAPDILTILVAGPAEGGQKALKVNLTRVKK